MSRKQRKQRSRVLIVDDHPAVREALVLRIDRQRDLEVCGEAADMNEALRLLASAQPDVAVVDLTLKTSCELTTHRLVRKVFLLPPHHPPECLREPTVAA